MSKVAELTDQEFKNKVENAPNPVLIDFSASWCAPCKALAPTIESVAEEYQGRLEVYKVDIEQAPEAAGTYGISSVPTCLFFKDGKVVDQFVGNRDLKAVKEIVEKHV